MFPSHAITVCNSYKQSGAQCNFIGTASTPRYPVSLAKCASLCTESETCSTFATIPGEQCALFETCAPKCTPSHGDGGWTIYTIDGKWLASLHSYFTLLSVKIKSFSLDFSKHRFKNSFQFRNAKN